MMSVPAHWNPQLLHEMPSLQQELRALPLGRTGHNDQASRKTVRAMYRLDRGHGRFSPLARAIQDALLCRARQEFFLLRVGMEGEGLPGELAGMRHRRYAVWWLRGARLRLLDEGQHGTVACKEEFGAWDVLGSGVSARFFEFGPLCFQFVVGLLSRGCSSVLASSGSSSSASLKVRLAGKSGK